MDRVWIAAGRPVRRYRRACLERRRVAAMNSTPETSALDGWRVAALLARVVVGGLFVATAIAKLADPLKFAEEIQNYQLVPIALTHLLALVLPWLEGLAGLLLALGVW
ncbi:MAG: DoxX family membrane protein, partial [Planctomycetota bacterium]